MKIKNHFEQAILNILAAKLRSFLALLGILVGTASIVALISSGELATEKALAEFKSLGTKLLSVSVFKKQGNNPQGGQAEISLSQWRQFPENIPQIEKLAPYALSYKPVSVNGLSLNAVIIGADASLKEVLNIQLQQGHFVYALESFERVCVIGEGLAKELKQRGILNARNQLIKVDNVLYRVVGIAKKWHENSFFNEDINQAVLIPITGMPLIDKDSNIDHAIVLLRSDDSVDLVIEHITRLVRHFAPKLSVFIRNAKQVIDSMESQGKIFTLLLAVIGGISLVVGGIGVMNVMLVSVSERKKEIGIRKAVGAQNRDIEWLFLIESTMLSFIGGVLGIVTGLSFTYLVAYFIEWPLTIHMMPIFIGFVVSVGVGIFFGYYPAKRASKLNPVETLRSET